MFFSKRYFGSAYFAPRYWPGGVSLPVPVTVTMTGFAMRGPGMSGVGIKP